MSDIEDVDYPGFQPLANYRGLAYGPNFTPQNRGSESTAIDGTNRKLRDPALGSPFTFRVRPPAVLLSALAGQGEARRKHPFDPGLTTVYEEAFKEFERVEVLFSEGKATEQQLENARQALLGGRPSAGNNVNIIETAQRANSHFSKVVTQHNQFDARSFTASSPTQGAGLTDAPDMIARDGKRFDPQKVEQSSANQTAVSDLDQAMSALVQLNKMRATPALTLLVNPEQLQIQYQKKQVYTDRNRFNYIFQSWGEEQVRLSVSGRSAGFVTGTTGVDNFEDVDIGDIRTKTVSGYQYASKWDSAAWQNLMSLFAFYRNNGYIYDLAGRPRSEAHLFIGNIEITYDQWVYVGNFENFSYEYSEGKQHGAVNFSFDFVASFIYDRSQLGKIEKWKSPTPSPGDVGKAATGAASDSVGSEASIYSRSSIKQTLPDGAGGSPSTAILGFGVDPFSKGNAFQGPEIAPGVFAPPGSTSFFPTGNGGGFRP